MRGPWPDCYVTDVWAWRSLRTGRGGVVMLLVLRMFGFSARYGWSAPLEGLRPPCSAAGVTGVATGRLVCSATSIAGGVLRQWHYGHGSQPTSPLTLWKSPSDASFTARVVGYLAPQRVSQLACFAFGTKDGLLNFGCHSPCKCLSCRAPLRVSCQACSATDIAARVLRWGHVAVAVVALRPEWFISSLLAEMVHLDDAA